VIVAFLKFSGEVWTGPWAEITKMREIAVIIPSAVDSSLNWLTWFVLS